MSDQPVPDTGRPAHPEPQRGTQWIRWLGGAAVAVAVLAAAVAAIRWAGSIDRQDLQGDQLISSQWNNAIKRLGFEPVYPPVEDLAVGDVLALVTADSVAGEPLAGQSLKLMHLDLTAEIEENYRQTYRFPATTARPDQNGQIWAQIETAESLFKPPAARTTLPLVLFPRFTIVHNRRAEAGGSFSGVLQGIFGAAAGSTESIDVQISATETYGVSALPAELRLLNFCEDKSTQYFCTEEGLRRQLSIVLGSKINDKIKDPKTGQELPRFSVELALVNRVFLARSIQTSFSSGSSTSVRGKVAQPRPPGSTEPQPAPPGDGGAGAPAGQTLARTIEERGVAAFNAQRDSSGFVALQRDSSSGVLLPDTILARPLVVGFRSVRWKP